MNLREVILDCNQYADTEDLIHVVFVKKTEGSFEPLSESIVLKLTMEEMAMNFADLQSLKCPEYEYFLEMDIIQELFEDTKDMEEFKSDGEKVKRVIYYAEFDA